MFSRGGGRGGGRGGTGRGGRGAGRSGGDRKLNRPDVNSLLELSHRIQSTDVALQLWKQAQPVEDAVGVLTMNDTGPAELSKQSAEEKERISELSPKHPDAMTSNGAAALSTTQCARVDLFYQMVRDADTSVIETLLPTAWSENAEHLVQLLLHARDARNGKGEKHVSLCALLWLRKHKPATYLLNLFTFLSLGYFKDLLQLAAMIEEQKLDPLGATERRLTLSHKKRRTKEGPTSAPSADAEASSSSSSSTTISKEMELVELELFAEFLRNDWQALQASHQKLNTTAVVKMPAVEPNPEMVRKRARQAEAATVVGIDDIGYGGARGWRGGFGSRGRGGRGGFGRQAHRGRGRGVASRPSVPPVRRWCPPPRPTEDEYATATQAPVAPSPADVAASSETTKISKTVCDLVYSDYAGVSVIRRSGVNYDHHSNPLGSEFDLAKDGAFKGYTVVIGRFYSDPEFNMNAMSRPISALEAKGFTVRHTLDEKECAEWLRESSTDAAWIISGSGTPLPDLLVAMDEFHRSGKGIFLFGDNDPFFSHANAFLQSHEVQLVGDYLGQRHLSYSNTFDPAFKYDNDGKFGTHLLFTGVQRLYEGTTICHVQTENKGFVPIAVASDGQVCISVLDPIPSKFNLHPTAPDRRAGRIALDCAFTKLYISWDTAGTARYVVNATCWVIGAERGLKPSASVLLAETSSVANTLHEKDEEKQDSECASSMNVDHQEEPTNTDESVEPIDLVSQDGNDFELIVKEEHEEKDSGIVSDQTASAVTAASKSTKVNSVQLTLAGKWAPTENGAWDRKHGFASRLAHLVFPSISHPMKAYREMLSACRRHLDVTERLMCAKQFDRIDFAAVPARCHALLKASFHKHCSVQYNEYLGKLQRGETKINTSGLLPHDIATPYITGIETVPDLTIEGQWKALISKLRVKYCTTPPSNIDDTIMNANDACSSHNTSTSANTSASASASSHAAAEEPSTPKVHPGLGAAVAVVDVSGSMTANDSLPLRVAISLGLLVSELASGPFHGRVLTFSESPKWHVIPQNVTLLEQVTSLNRAEWGFNTDFVAVFDRILETAIAAKCASSDLPRTLFVFSDMQFDQAAPNMSTSMYDVIKSKFTAAGYDTPGIVFWNLAGSTPAIFPADVTTEGVALLGGYSPELFKAFLEGSSSVASNSSPLITPIDTLLRTIGSYQAVIEESER